jgi:hypothetical protein
VQLTKVSEHFGVSHTRLPKPNFDAVSASAVVFIVTCEF